MISVKLERRRNTTATSAHETQFPIGSCLGSYRNFDAEEIILKVDFDGEYGVAHLTGPHESELRKYGRRGEYERYVANVIADKMAAYVKQQLLLKLEELAKKNQSGITDVMQYLFKEPK